MSVQVRYDAVKAKVEAACRAAGRPPDAVELIAVSKTHPLASVVEVAALGQRHFGESYAQELRDKSAARPDLLWHFIGHIQSNKAKVIASAYRIHALCDKRHASALVAHADAPLKCLVAVNLGGESSKSGVSAADALAACRDLNAIDGIDIVGLMTLPPAESDPSPYFEQLADLAARGRHQGLALTELSMGMTSDFEAAIAHGATWVRVGTAIFGARS